MKNSGLNKILLSVFVVLLLMGVDVSGEEVGKIVDENGRPVAGAQVSILIYAPQLQTKEPENTKEVSNKAETASEKLRVTTE